VIAINARVALIERMEIAHELGSTDNLNYAFERAP
jgi:hypothetical protein